MTVQFKMSKFLKFSILLIFLNFIYDGTTAYYFIWRHKKRSVQSHFLTPSSMEKTKKHLKPEGFLKFVNANDSISPSAVDTKVLQKLLDLLNSGKKTMGLNTDNPQSLLKEINVNLQTDGKFADTRLADIMKESSALESEPYQEGHLSLTGNDKEIHVYNSTHLEPNVPKLGNKKNDSEVEGIFKMIIEKEVPKNDKKNTVVRLTLVERKHMKHFPSRKSKRHNRKRHKNKLSAIPNHDGLTLMERSHLKSFSPPKTPIHKVNKRRKFYTVPKHRRKRNMHRDEDYGIEPIYDDNYEEAYYDFATKNVLPVSTPGINKTSTNSNTYSQELPMDKKPQTLIIKLVAGVKELDSNSLPKQQTGEENVETRYQSLMMILFMTSIGFLGLLLIILIYRCYYQCGITFKHNVQPPLEDVNVYQDGHQEINSSFDFDKCMETTLWSPNIKYDTEYVD